MKTFSASLAVGASCFALLLTAGAPAQAACSDTPPLMTIKIFNRDPDFYIFPVLTMGKGGQDIWLQSCFKVPAAQIGREPYPRGKNFRIYAFPKGGIAPQKQPSDSVASITLTLPLYTKMVSNVVPTQPDQYIDWWQGGTIQLFASKTPNPPKALLEAMQGKGDLKQKEVTPVAGAVLPLCPQCQQPLKLYSDEVDLPKSDPSQLIEYTLGARVALDVKNPEKDPPNDLDVKNVDFDVSYVNVAALPVAMGPYQNGQVGYVGTPLRIKDFKQALNNFLGNEKYKGWPRFVKKYSDGKTETILKLPSPLEIFARLGPGLLAPPDLEPPPHWPDRLWKPIEDLRTNWVKYAGTINSSGFCKATKEGNTFCDAIIDVKNLMKANYQHYSEIFDKACTGKKVELSDNLLISHVYAWSPFIEAAPEKDEVPKDKGCPAGVNLLQDTPGYKANDFAKYRQVKEEFDRLNYGKFQNADAQGANAYDFNPWVTLIHGKGYVDAPNVYAFSVDDAVGNIQAEGTGFIVDIGSTKDLENQHPAGPPIKVGLGYDPCYTVRFTNYRLCKNDPSRDKPILSSFAGFDINASEPEKCPIYLYAKEQEPAKDCKKKKDNKKKDGEGKSQLYTFTITKGPKSFPFFDDPEHSPPKWDKDTTAAPIDCSGNTVPSSKTWCRDSKNSRGVFAYSQPEPHSVHGTKEFIVNTLPPLQKVEQ